METCQNPEASYAVNSCDAVSRAVPEQDATGLVERSTLERRLPIDDQLCKNCRRIDFERLFDGTRTVGLSKFYYPLTTARREKFCPLCRVVTSLAERFTSRHRLSDLCKIQCSVSRLYSSAREDFRRTDIARYARLRICVYVIPSYRKGIKYTGYAAERPQKQVCLLDRVLHASQGSDSSKKGKIRRHLLSTQFDPNILRSWITDVIKAEAAISNRHQPDDDYAAVQILIRKGRFRVLDVQKKEIVILKELQRYSALSYVWGLALAEKAREPSTWPMRWDDVPCTTRDTAMLLEEIGEQYLWVYLLCISQDNPVDKQVILPYMGPIYATADLVIVDANSDYANSGLSRFAKNSAITE